MVGVKRRQRASRVQVFAPQGVCNGFQTLEDTEYLYFFDNEWAPGMPGTALCPLDPELGIKWPIAIDISNLNQISEKDSKAPTLIGKNYNVIHYNLDMIISLGYRIKSSIATRFRRWATERIKEYMIKGFTMDDERLKGNGGGKYWNELLDRIRDIRSSEKVLYRQVLDLYATSVDYNPNSEQSILFFKIVQNKLHYAAHGHTATEVIYERADAEKPFMGLTSFKGELPALKDIGIAKNYLNEDELKILNNLVSGYFDLAEINAIEHRPMYMSDYVEQLDSVLSSGNR